MAVALKNTSSHVAMAWCPEQNLDGTVASLGAVHTQDTAAMTETPRPNEVVSRWGTVEGHSHPVVLDRPGQAAAWGSFRCSSASKTHCIVCGSVNLGSAGGCRKVESTGLVSAEALRQLANTCLPCGFDCLAVWAAGLKGVSCQAHPDDLILNLTR